MKDKKEERILIFKVENPCSDNCEIKDIQSCKTCNVKKRYYEAKTYDTTIEKMARAIYFEIEKETETIKSKYTFSSKKFAEAALKALLEK